MSHAKMFVFLGRSRSGKDTAYRFANELHPGTLVKFANGIKKMVEQSYGLPEGAMEIDHYRNMVMPDSGKTFLEFLVESFKFYSEHAPMFWANMTLQKLRASLELGRDVYLTDLRMPAEITAVCKLSEKYPLHLMFLERSKSPIIPADKFIDQNLRELLGCSKSEMFVNNNGSLEYIEEKVKMFLKTT